MKVSAIHHIPMQPEHKSPFSAGFGVVVEGGKLVFFSGCGPIPIYHKHPHDPVAEEEWLKGDIREQTEKTFENIGIILRAAGGEFRHVIKLNIYMTDVKQQDVMNAISARVFGAANPPARTLVQVPALAHPKMLIEIEGVAAIA